MAPGGGEGAAPGRVLALDYGSARCGCAISDPTGQIATPLETVPAPATRRGLGRLAELVRETEATRVLVGLPLTLAGADSDQTRETREFARRLQRRVGAAVPVELYDERFTTRIAQRTGGTRSGEDARAAAALLESWLVARVRFPA